MFFHRKQKKLAKIVSIQNAYNFLNRAFFVFSWPLKRLIRGRVRLAYKNSLTKTSIRTLLVRRKLYGTRLRFDKIGMSPNNLSKTQMLSHVCHYFQAFFCPVMKRGDMCGANV